MHRATKVLNSAVLISAFVMLACSGGSAPREASAQPDQDMSAAGQEIAQAGDSKMAPAFALKNLAGESVSLESYKGKVLIIDFWATWCPPCVKEIPHFVELYESYNGKGLEILGVSVDRGGPGVVEGFVAKNNVKYAIAMADMEVVDAYEVYTGIPTTYIVDRNGMIVDKVIGYREKSFFEDYIKKLL